MLCQLPCVLTGCTCGYSPPFSFLQHTSPQQWCWQTVHTDSCCVYLQDTLVSIALPSFLLSPQQRYWHYTLTAAMCTYRTHLWVQPSFPFLRHTSPQLCGVSPGWNLGSFTLPATGDTGTNHVIKDMKDQAKQWGSVTVEVIKLKETKPALTNWKNKKNTPKFAKMLWSALVVLSKTSLSISVFLSVCLCLPFLLLPFSNTH